MSSVTPNFSRGYEPVSPVDITSDSLRSRSDPFLEESEAKEAQVGTRSLRTNSTVSTTPSQTGARKARFAEATSVLSPAAGPGEHQSPFADPIMPANDPKPSDVGFGYIADNQPVEQHATLRPDANGAGGLKSAMKTPGTAARLLNPLSPTFREEAMLEKQEEKTDKEQARDLKIKTRVRMAKMVLRGVNFSCSLIVLAMLSTVLTIFHATRSLPPRNNLPAWAPNTPLWPQIVVLTIACISLLFSIIVIGAYCRGGHRRAEKVAVYYTMFAVGWFMFSIVMWLVGAGILHGSKNNSGGTDVWAWSCKDNKRRAFFQDDVHYALVCRLNDWSLICCIIEVVVEVIVIAIYGIVFYRFYSKNRLRKSMDARDRARTDLYLAQLRSQSAPNTPGFAQTPRSGAALPNHTASTPRTPFFPATTTTTTPPQHDAPESSQTQYATLSPQSNTTSSPFKLQAPPIKIHHPTPRANQEEFEDIDMTSPIRPQSQQHQQHFPRPTSRQQQQDRVNEHVQAAPGEVQYEAVPIPGAYATHQNQTYPGQAY